MFKNVRLVLNGLVSIRGGREKDLERERLSMGGVATRRGVPEPQAFAFFSQARLGNILHSGKLSARLCSAAEARTAGAPSATAGRSWRWNVQCKGETGG